MLTKSKVPLRASQRKEQQRRKLRRQANIRALVLIAIIIVACVFDLVFSQTDDGKQTTNLLIAKSVALGAMLNWFAHAVFAWFVFRFTEVQEKNKIVSHLYLGQIIKWFIVIAGFTIIFMTTKSLSATAIIIGFFVMQIGHLFTLLKIS